MEIYINKSDEKFDSLLMNIHRKFTSNGKDTMSLLREEIDWSSLYSNILSLLSNETPNLTFFSNLLRIPLSKLNFIVILNNLKNPKKAVKAIEEAEHSTSFRGIVENLKIDHSEIIHIIRICLNLVDYDKLNQLIKIMKLEKQINVDVLISLLVIDLRVERSPEKCRE